MKKKMLNLMWWYNLRTPVKTEVVIHNNKNPSHFNDNRLNE